MEETDDGRGMGRKIGAVSGLSSFFVGSGSVCVGFVDAGVIVVSFLCSSFPFCSSSSSSSSSPSSSSSSVPLQSLSFWSKRLLWLRKSFLATRAFGTLLISSTVRECVGRTGRTARGGTEEEEGARGGEGRFTKTSTSFSVLEVGVWDPFLDEDDSLVAVVSGTWRESSSSESICKRERRTSAFDLDFLLFRRAILSGLDLLAQWADGLATLYNLRRVQGAPTVMEWALFNHDRALLSFS